MPFSQCDYESPVSSIQFLLGMPEVHAAITFIFTSISSYLIYHIPSYGFFSAMVTLTIGLYYCRHLARGGRSAYIDAFMNAYYDTSTQITTLVKQSSVDPHKTVIIDPSTFFSRYIRPTAIITGCSSGIGLATVKQFLLMGASCILAVRDVEKMKLELELFFDQLLKDHETHSSKRDAHQHASTSPGIGGSGSNDDNNGNVSPTLSKDAINNLRQMVTIVYCDLNNLLSVRNFAFEVERMNICNLAFVVNNAGAMVTRQRLISEHISPVLRTTTTKHNADTGKVESVSSQYGPFDGSVTDFQPSTITDGNTTVATEIITTVDNSFATNHLGHFLLTLLLLPMILKHGSRVINLSSAIVFSIPSSIQVVQCLMNFDKANTKQVSAQTETWDAPTAYGRTKICNIWFTRALQQRFDRLYQEVIDENTTTAKIYKSLIKAQHHLQVGGDDVHHPSSVDEGNGNGHITSSLSSSSHITFASAFAVHPGTVWSPFHLPFYRETAYGLAMLFPLIMLPLSFFSMKSGYYGALTTVHCAVGRHPLFSMIGEPISQLSLTASQPTPLSSGSLVSMNAAAAAVGGGGSGSGGDADSPASLSSLTGLSSSIPTTTVSTSSSSSASASVSPANTSDGSMAKIENVTSKHPGSGSTATKNMLVVEHSPSTGPQPGQLHADCRVVSMSQVATDMDKADELFKLSLLLCRQFINRQNYPLYNHL